MTIYIFKIIFATNELLNKLYMLHQQFPLSANTSKTILRIEMGPSGISFPNENIKHICSLKSLICPHCYAIKEHLTSKGLEK